MRRLALVAAARTGRREMDRLVGPRRRAPARRVPPAAAYAACAAVALLGLAVGRADLSSVAAAPGEPASALHVRVIDGDTLDIGGERVRIANIDTPEMPPRSRCASEADGALRARDRLKAITASGSVTLERTGTDRYGRTLANVSVGGADAGRALIAAGLARPWEGRRRSWCG